MEAIKRASENGYITGLETAVKILKLEKEEHGGDVDYAITSLETFIEEAKKRYPEKKS